MNKAAMIFPGDISPELQDELGANITFYNAVLDEALEIALQCEKDGVDVIISRAGTAALIKKAVKVPVVNCEVTHSDLIDVLLRIKKEHQGDLQEIGFVNYGNVSYDVRSLEELTHIKIRQSWYWSGGTELRERVKDFKDAGIKVVLGASMTVRFCEELGIKGYLMQIGRETLRQAVQKAREILEIRRNDLAYSEKIKSMLSFAREGILFVNEKDVIDYANPRARSMLGGEKRPLEDCRVAEVLPDWEKGKDGLALDTIAQIGKNQILYNKIPVNVHGEKAGSVVTFTETAQIQRVEEKIRSFMHEKGFVASYSLDDIAGQSAAIRQAVEKAKIYAETDATVLISGETGTGKELFAHGVHKASLRKNQPFVAINCAALPENLLESELFGYTEGSFTGARRGGRAGYFELAHGGTLFLDEIGELRLPLQGKLLRAIEKKEVMRLGGDRVIPVNTRIIAATNRDLLTSVEQKEFRGDLYYRLNVLSLHIPALRQRREDIAVLAEYFRRRFGFAAKKDVPSFSLEFQRVLENYDWPGNVRELECFINRYCLLAGHVKDEYIIDELRKKTLPQESSERLNIVLRDMAGMMDEIYAKVYAMTGENKSKTAELLGVNRMTVGKWLKQRELYS